MFTEAEMAAAAFRRNLRYKERMSLRSRSRDISPFDYKRVHRARESDDSSNDEFGRRKRRERSKEKSPKKRKKRRKVSSNSKERKIRKKSKKKSKKNESRSLSTERSRRNRKRETSEKKSRKKNFQPIKGRGKFKSNSFGRRLSSSSDDVKYEILSTPPKYSRSRSNSSKRSRERSSVRSWSHDKFRIISDSFSPPRKRIPGYVPPEPTWKSRAGGVYVPINK
mmetsp:Transcript_13268/g.18701  ORF Transcript_13268/g.18701 Transcript_13268/m.18701 type:complete len:223 (+) Transcript_13268:197-865(+)